MPIHEIFKPISKWIRKTVRQRTRPVPRDVAEERQMFFSTVYFLSALGLMVLVLADIAKRDLHAVPYKRNRDKKLSQAKEEKTEELSLDEYEEVMKSKEHY
ncbi:hypothetical protein Phum_PHUM528660 [Pediculus humanus corporis]|uniref:Uncharacterized protein n=1 Tax=Pediculus humanus subsp. corporis TaxID=121224 RepID=E0VZ84_PEDHC|nr:uncharacterized protein Phum_PHUM528660 [Pediculus humanus corporis]EEB18690.1 hypothetical protein Phum_PHUM528660 [Pediculus humanus corporis]